MPDEFDDGKEAFRALVRNIDPALVVVIPTASSGGNFLISLTKGDSRKFVTLTEEDLLDLVETPAFAAKLRPKIESALK